MPSAVLLGLLFMLGLASLGLFWFAAGVNWRGNLVIGAAVFQLAILGAIVIIAGARLKAHERLLRQIRERYLRHRRTARRAWLKARQTGDELMRERSSVKVTVVPAQSNRRKVDKSNEEKERFFSAAYHDLQQPLSIIGLYVRAAKTKLETPAQSPLLADLAIIEDAAQDIALMFKSVRDTCEIGHAKPRIEAVNLNAVLEEIERELRERAERKGLVFRLHQRLRPPVWVQSDRTLLKRALSNLVSNAIKYTDRGGVLMGTVNLKTQVRIDVRDTGVGIPAEFQARVFDEYFQVDNPGGNRKQGLGLGLYIVRRIENNLPEHHLSFSSRPGKGSRFSLHVPSAPALALTPPAAMPGRDEVLVGKYIVIVEDEPVILDGLLEIVRNVGCIADGAGSAEAARKLFGERARCPDILMTDLRLRGGQTGLDAVNALRERFEWAIEIPVLFVTGDLTPLSAVGDFEGPFEIYRKPIDPEALLNKLRELVTRPPA